MKIVELTLENTELMEGFDALAFVEKPAIQEGFFAFADIEFAESYTDYPEAAVNNAKRALKWAEENGWGSCGTAVGKARANQLAKREPISEETIARMSSFRRQQENKNTPYGEGCGGLMWDAWGGDAGIDWAERKLEEIREDKEKMSFSQIEALVLNHILEPLKHEKFSSVEEQQMIISPIMIPGKLILRQDEETNEPYYVFFKEETIRDMAYKALAEKLIDRVNIEHDAGKFVENVCMAETWIVEDSEKDKSTLYGFTPKKGTWFAMYKVENPEVWAMIKAGKVKGVSLEGIFRERQLQ
jgi:hypothetical protein